MQLAKVDRPGVRGSGKHVMAWEALIVLGQVEAIKGTCTLVNSSSGLEGAWVQIGNLNQTAWSSNPVFTIFKIQTN